MTIATKRDITERKQVEEALQESEEKYKTLVEDAPIGIYFNDFRGTFLYGNKKAEEITGYKREELLGKSFLKLKLLDPKGFGKAIKLLALNKLGKATGPERFVLNRKGGTKSIVEIRTRITTFGDKKVVLGMVEDVTERKQAEAQLQESEQKYRTIFENVSDVIIRLDKYGKILDINGKAEKCFGYKPEEIIGKNFARIGVLSLKDTPKMVKLFSEIIRGKRAPFTIEVASKRKDGSTVLLDVSTTLVRKEGKTEGFVTIVRDITERKKAEQALADEATRRRILIDQSRDGIVVLDENGKVYETNQHFAEMLGYTYEEAAQLHVWDWEFLFPHEQVLDMIRSVDEAGDNFETQHRRKDGSVYDVEISTNGALIAGKKLIFCVCRDITERKRLEQEREQLLRNLEDKTKELEQIIYVSSHDLRSPLVNIQGFTRELEQSLKEVRSATQGGDIPPTVAKKLAVPMDEDIPTALKYILASTSKIDLLLSGLLRLSRLGRAALAVKNLDMNKLMADVIHAFEFNIKEAEVTLEVEGLPSCRGDNTQINQVFSNLIDNSLKFLDHSRHGIIRVSGRKKDGQVIFCVEDNGIGIAPEHREKVFEIFQRLDPGASSGEGLGLTIVWRIIDRHSGKIWLESELGKGSKFFVSLPAA